MAGFLVDPTVNATALVEWMGNPARMKVAFFVGAIAHLFKSRDVASYDPYGSFNECVNVFTSLA